MSGTRDGNHFKHRRCYTTTAKIEHHDGIDRPLTLYKRRMTLERMIRRYADTSSPEARLWCAVLTRAVKDFATKDHRPQFWANGSADTICQALGIEPDALHRWALRLKLPLRDNVRRIRRRRVL
jgi:hypothetical protein